MSLGAQSFQPPLLAVLERRAQPEDVRRSVHVLRDAGFDNISLDLVYGIPGQSPADLEADLAEALALEPEHVSCYELEAKPGTRFTHAHGAELERQAESMETYFERVVDDADRGRLPLVRDGELLPRSRTGATCGRGTTSATGSDGTTSASGSARSRQSTACGGGTRRGSRPTSPRSRRARRPQRELEPLDDGVRRAERLLLGLRLDEPLRLEGLDGALDRDALERLERLGLAERTGVNGDETLALTERGRFLGGGVTADLLA